jgi:hypothetical protein
VTRDSFPLLFGGLERRSAGAKYTEPAIANRAASRAPLTVLDTLVAGSMPHETEYDLMGDAARSVCAALETLWRPHRYAHPSAGATPRVACHRGAPVPVDAHWRYDMAGMGYRSTHVRDTRFGRRRSCTVARSAR